jgi:hypothetical protein
LDIANKKYVQISVDMLYPLKHNAYMKGKPSKEIREYMASLGRKGGKATGVGKGLNSEQARKAARARWDKVKTKQKKT